MSKKVPNDGKRWTPDDKAELRERAHKNQETPQIAKALGRTEVAIYNKASEMNASLMPKDK